MASMVALKKDLRKKIKVILQELPEAAAAAQTSSVTKTLLSMPEYKAARRISVYLSMPTGEISTTGIVHDALSQGKRVFIPYTYNISEPREGHPRSIMDMVELKSIADFESFELDKWNIPTPTRESIHARPNSFGGLGKTGAEAVREPSDEVGLDLIVMPGMAFDSKFGRLGHGKGFYDYFLSRCHQVSRIPHQKLVYR